MSVKRYLDGHYSLFGEVTSGMAVLERISKVPTHKDESPLQPVVLEHVKIVREHQDCEG